jgi:SAM-dependent methyltransferase
MKLGYNSIYNFRISPKQYIGWVPTPLRVVYRMLELAEIEAGEIVYDLGCGDGRILKTAVRKYQARGVGIDIDPERIEKARRRSRRFLDRITFQCQNVLKTELRRADVVTIYLLPDLNRKLMPQLAKLKKGSRVITHAFALPGVQPYKVAHLTGKDGLNHDVYAYRVPFQHGDGYSVRSK